MDEDKNLEKFNLFCKNISEGVVLYNLNTTNHWGELLLVASICPITVHNTKTYTVLLVGVKREEGNLTIRNTRIKFTPDYADSIPFLKYVGHCKFSLLPKITETKLNMGLMVTYGSVDLWKYRKKLSIRKPKKRKYGNDGEPIVK
jgi:hypothetical protein